MGILDVLFYYAVIALITLILTCLGAGYSGRKYNRTDVIDSIYWPLSYAVIIGVFIRVLFLVIKDLVKTKIKGNK